MELRSHITSLYMTDNSQMFYEIGNSMQTHFKRKQNYTILQIWFSNSRNLTLIWFSITFTLTMMIFVKLHIMADCLWVPFHSMVCTCQGIILLQLSQLILHILDGKSLFKIHSTACMINLWNLVRPLQLNLMFLGPDRPIKF